MDLESKFGDIAKREEYIAEQLGISVAEARDRIKSSSFSEYMGMLEANADRGFVGTQTTQSSSQGSSIPQMNTPATPVSAKDDQEFDRAVKQVSSPTAQNELKRIKDLEKTDPEQASREYEDFKRKNPTFNDEESGLSQFFSNVKSGFMQGLSSELAKESAELARMKELAGIQESATTGSTMSGNIASTPSIVGDTSDSHKPSVKLRRDNRLERQEKEKQDAKQDRQNRKEQEKQESNIERLIKR